MADETSLRAFFLKVSEDEALFERYKKNPEEVLRENGVSPEGIQAVVKGDLRAIRRLLGHDGKPGLNIVVMFREK